jgi:hypothetical protein
MAENPVGFLFHPSKRHRKLHSEMKGIKKGIKKLHQSHMDGRVCVCLFCP